VTDSPNVAPPEIRPLELSSAGLSNLAQNAHPQIFLFFSSFFCLTASVIRDLGLLTLFDLRLGASTALAPQTKKGTTHFWIIPFMLTGLNSIRRLAKVPQPLPENQ
jgi:hypothetical protein